MKVVTHVDNEARFTAGFGVAVLGFLVGALVSLPLWLVAPVEVAALPAVVIGALGLWRGGGIRVVEEPNGLVVRNVFRTRRVAWTDVEEFDTGISALVSTKARHARCPVLRLRDGSSVMLLAMPLSYRSWPFRARYDDEWVQVVERWERRVGTHR